MQLKLHTPGNEPLWIEKATRGDLDAFNQLVLTYQDMAYNHAYAMLGDDAEAQDATQESFIKAFQAIDQFRGGSFRSWLLKIVTNTAYDFLRRSCKRATQPLFPVDEEGEELESAAWLADPAPSVQAVVEQKDLSNELNALLNDLPDVYRSVLVLVDVQELDYGEAAQALSVPIGTIKSRLARARLQMQEKLKGRVNFPGRVANTAACLAA
jgi:RNA polymerase sigma-70 factor (ECF subfamily)